LSHVLVNTVVKSRSGTVGDEIISVFSVAIQSHKAGNSLPPVCCSCLL